MDSCTEWFNEGLRKEGIEEGKKLKINFQNANFDTGTMAAKILKNEVKAEYMDYEFLKDNTIYIDSEYLEKLNIKILDSIKDKAIDVSKTQE